MEEGKDAEEEARRRLEEEMEEFQREEDDKVKQMWKQEEAKVEELQKREEERVRIMLASARTEAALNAGRSLPAAIVDHHGQTSEEEMVRKMVEPAKAKTEAAMKNSQDTWRQEEERVKALKRREEERMKILVASAKTQAAKNIEKASAESEERVRRKIAEKESLLSQ